MLLAKLKKESHLLVIDCIDAYILFLVWLDEYPVAQRLHLQHMTVVRYRAQLR